MKLKVHSKQEAKEHPIEKSIRRDPSEAAVFSSVLLPLLGYTRLRKSGTNSH